MSAAPQEQQDLTLPEVHKVKNAWLHCVVTREQREEYKLLALRAGYTSVADLIRAGLLLVKERVEAREKLNS